MKDSGVTDNDVTKEFANIDKKIRVSQVQLLYQQTVAGLVGALLVAIGACGIFWQVIPQWKLSLWMGIVALLTLARGGVAFAFKRRVVLMSEIDRWATLHVIGVVLSGLAWAVPFVFLWPVDNLAYQSVWPIVVLPLSAAAVAIYYTWTPSYVLFLVLTVLPMSLRFFVEGGELFIILGILSLFLILILLRAGKVMHVASVRSFDFGIRNEALNVELKDEIVIREQLNTRLQKEIAERQLADREIRKFSKVFLNGTTPTFIEDLKGNMQEMNNEAVNVYGFSREELVDKSIKFLVPDEKHEQIDDLIKRCMKGELVRDVEGLQRKKDGNGFPVLMTLSLLTDEDNNPFGIASIASNISVQKSIEKQLMESKAVAESANATKDKFFKIISHDLRSPFNSIIGFSNLLTTQYDSFDDLKRKDCIQKINTSALYAYDLLDNLLSWARNQTDGIKISKEIINLRSLVETSISSYLLDAESKNISIVNNVQAELMIFIDENTALTFIRNIVSNAIKFTHSGGVITIDSYLDEDVARLHITDTGVGMLPEVLDNLFQIDKDISTSGTNNEKGTGLGLILSKEFIERNGGSIIVKSEVGKGSEFIISLPR